MPDQGDVYRATIGELVENFRGALLAVLPMADRAKMSPLDANPHRDWERLAETIFDAFVRGPIQADAARDDHELPLARYDIDHADYLGLSWLAIDAEAPFRSAVVRLLSTVSPFDTVQTVEIDPVTLLAGPRRTCAASGLEFVFFRRNETGQDFVVTEIEAVE